ncbi:MAG TPA: hypothetical protein DDW52_08990 [Planctomycetaceae bacterium]|nr:hypothetical protein [Planctomycetaceae bacterium]
MAHKQTQGRDQGKESRRGFLRESSFLIAGAMPGVTASPIEDQTDSLNAAGCLKIGVVGCGRRGLQLARQAMNDGHEIVALADITADAVQRFVRGIGSAERFNVSPSMRFAGVDAYERLLATPVDSVILATAPADRPTQVELALSAAKNVIAARPLAVDLQGLRQFENAFNAAQREGLKWSVPCDLLGSPAVAASLDAIRSGVIGQVLNIRTLVRGHPLPSFAPQQSAEVSRRRNWQHDALLSGGGPLEQLHDRFAICELIAGQPLEIQGICSAIVDSPSGASARNDAAGLLNQLAVDVKYADCWMQAFWRRTSTEWAGPKLLVQGTLGSCDLETGKIANLRRERIEITQAIPLKDGAQSQFDLSAASGMAAIRATKAAILARDAAVHGKRQRFNEPTNC